MRRKSVKVGDLTLRWQEKGQGIPVVCIHGVPTGPQLWQHVAPRVRAARFIAWEMVGYGDSIDEGRHRDLSVRAQADYLRRFLDAAGIGRVILVGHDSGGGVAQLAALDEPNRCAGLVLVDSIAYTSWPIGLVRFLQLTGPIVRRMPDRVFETAVRAFFRAAHDDPAMAAESAEVHLRAYREHDGAAAFSRQIAPFRTRDTSGLDDRLRGLGVPARVVWGEDDPFQTIDVGERLARDLGAPLKRIPGARHYVPEDHPVEVASAIQELVAQEAKAARARRLSVRSEREEELPPTL